MADASLVKVWLLDAAELSEAPHGAVEQVTWLQSQRTAYATAIKAGDWELSAMNDAGGSASSRRGVSDLAHHDAIVAALAKLGATALGEGGALIQPLFSPGVG